MERVRRRGLKPCSLRGCSDRRLPNENTNISRLLTSFCVCLSLFTLEYIIIEDITASSAKPTLMDMKMGTSRCAAFPFSGVNATTPLPSCSSYFYHLILVVHASFAPFSALLHCYRLT